MPETGVSGDEFSSRYNFSVRFVYAIITLTLILVALAFARLYPRFNSFDPNLFVALRISILFFGLGAVVVRRTRLNAARLSDIASLRGASGLLASLQKTTIIVAALAGAMAVMAFIIAAQTGDAFDVLLPAIAALAILLFSYPRRALWERALQAAQNGEIKDQPVTKGSAT